MVENGVIITFATITLLVAEFIRRRRFRYSIYGWLGIVCVVGAEWLMFRGSEPVATFFTPIAWSAYILIVDAAVLAVTGRSRLRNAPLGLLRMAGISIPLWMIFEAYNLRLRNWNYDGVPDFWFGGLIGYAWSFATITPAIFETADLIQAFLPFRELKSIKISRGAQAGLMILGAVCLIVPLVLPQRIGAYLFALSDQLPGWVAVVSGGFFGGIAYAILVVSGGGVGLRVALGILELLVGGEVALHL